MTGIGTLWRTVRHLRWQQTVGRVRFKLTRPKPDLRQPPQARLRSGCWVEVYERSQSFFAPSTFEFLNERYELDAIGWDSPTVSKLWRYNLHYFDDLNAAGSHTRRTDHLKIIDRWIRENPPARGTGWDPYPTSLRIVNWIKWALADHPLSMQAQASLAVQARWLTGRLEHHLMGNHLLANAKALLFAGCYFTGPEADEWLATGSTIVSEQLSEQILDDGGHFELSPMYHALMLEDVLDLINVLRAHELAVPHEWEKTAARMLQWLEIMTHPDGEVAFFNDAAFGVAPKHATLLAYAARLRLHAASRSGEALVRFPASGYVRAAVEQAYLLCDCASLGPDYLLAHAHADTLSFELSLQQQRIFVNSGTSQYALGAERHRQRSTAAHNTVVVDRENSSEVWGSFRVGARAYARMSVVAEHGAVTILGAHDGYRRLPGRVTHERRWRLDAHELTIEDVLVGRSEHALARFHLHPEIRIVQVARDRVQLSWNTGTASVSLEGAQRVEAQESTWHPRFGVGLASNCLSISFMNNRLVTRVTWT